MRNDRHEVERQRQLAARLVGKMVRFAHMPADSKAYLALTCDRYGMVELLNQSGMFAPHLFVLAKELSYERAHA